MINEKPSLETVTNQFYRRNYPRLFRLMWAMIVINLMLVAVLIYFIVKKPDIKYYANYEKTTTPLYPLSIPIVSEDDLLNWASQAAVSVYTFDFLNYQKELASASHYFTPTAWQRFQESFSKVIQTVTDKKLRVTAVVVDSPWVIGRGPLLGAYSWKIVLPLLVTFEDASGGKSPQLLSVTILLTRVSTLDNPKGVAIAQFYTEERPLRSR